MRFVQKQKRIKMNKLTKKIKKWLAHKIGVYTIEEIPPQNFTIINRPRECLSLNLAIPNDAQLFESEAGLDFIEFKIKEEIRNFAIKELPKYMSFTIETNPMSPYQTVRCQLDIVPPVDKESLAELLTKKKTEKYDYH